MKAIRNFLSAINSIMNIGAIKKNSSNGKALNKFCLVNPSWSSQRNKHAEMKITIIFFSSKLQFIFGGWKKRQLSVSHLQKIYGGQIR